MIVLITATLKETTYTQKEKKKEKMMEKKKQIHNKKKHVRDNCNLYNNLKIFVIKKSGKRIEKKLTKIKQVINYMYIHIKNILFSFVCVQFCDNFFVLGFFILILLSMAWRCNEGMICKIDAIRHALIFLLSVDFLKSGCWLLFDVFDQFLFCLFSFSFFLDATLYFENS